MKERANVLIIYELTLWMSIKAGIQKVVTLLSENSDNKSSKVVLGYLCNILNECYPEENTLC